MYFLLFLFFLKFLKYKCMYFNWRLITLQYCIGFAIHVSTTSIHMFPILNPPPFSLPYHLSGSSQCTSPKHPVSCIEPRLVIRFIYDIIHISMPFSWIIPLSPSPTESKRLFYTSVSLLLSRVQGNRYHLSKFHWLHWSFLLWFCFIFDLIQLLELRFPHFKFPWVQCYIYHSAILIWIVTWLFLD